MNVARLRSLMSLGLALLVCCLGRDVVGQTPPPSAPTILVRDCRVKLIDSVTLASPRPGVLQFIEPREGDSVEARQQVAGLLDGVVATRLAAAEIEAQNDVDVRYARKVAEVAEAEYQKALDTNAQVRDAIPDIEVQRFRLAYERAELGIEQAEQQYRLSQLRRDQAAEELRTYRLAAPFAGVVTRVYKSVGESVGEGEPVLDIVNPERIRVEGYVPVKDVVHIRRRTPVEVHLDIADANVARRTFTGNIVFVDVKVQPVTGDVRVWAEVTNQDGLLRDGLIARMTIHPSQSPATNTRTTTKGRGSRQ